MSSATSTKDVSTKDGFTVGHLFVLLALMAATVAVVLSRPATPESLVLISLTIGAAGFAAVCFYRMLAPLVAPHTDLEQEPLSERLRADLEREKALTLRSIKELEFDHATGKVSDADFKDMDSRLRTRALALMQDLERAARAPVTDAREVRAEARHGCARCGAQNDDDARFCKSCGAKL